MDTKQHDTKPTATDRRGFLKCMSWAGSAMVWTVAGGIPRSHLIGHAGAAEPGLVFAQVSDSHLGFDKPVNPDVAATFEEALSRITAMPQQTRVPDPHR